MAHPPLDLSKARILVTNDDGIHAPGLKVLEKVARSLSEDATEGVNAFLEKRPADFPMKVSTDMPDFYPWSQEPEYD